MSTDAYRVVVTREDGRWLADVPDLRGAQTYACNLPSLDQTVRDAAALPGISPQRVFQLTAKAS